jgi:hypothetical protein
MKHQYRVCCDIVRTIFSYTASSLPSLVQPSKTPSVECMSDVKEEASLIENLNVWYIDSTNDDEIFAVRAVSRTQF